MTSDSPLVTLSALLSQRLQPDSVQDDAWPAIVESALEYGLSPMLLWVIDQQHLPLRPVWKPLVEDARQLAIFSLLLEEAQREVDRILSDAQIPAIWLKGIALGATIYPQPQLRPMLDLDVLVPEDRRQVAREALLANGYRQPPEDDSPAGVYARRTSHHDYLLAGRGHTIPLELHFRLLATDGPRLLPPDKLAWFFQQTQLFANGAYTFTGLKPEANLLYLSAHAILQHGESQFHLRRFLDMHLLITHSTLDWALLVDQAVALCWTYAVERALVLTRQYFASPIPDEVFDQLRQRRPADEDVSRVIRFQGSAIRWQQMRRLLAELPLPDKARAIRQVLLPPPAYMRQRYAVRAGWPVWVYYPYRWFDQGREMARAAAFWLARNIRKNS